MLQNVRTDRSFGTPPGVSYVYLMSSISCSYWYWNLGVDRNERNFLCSVCNRGFNRRLVGCTLERIFAKNYLVMFCRDTKLSIRENIPMIDQVSRERRIQHCSPVLLLDKTQHLLMRIVLSRWEQLQWLSIMRFWLMACKPVATAPKQRYRSSKNQWGYQIDTNFCSLWWISLIKCERGK